MALSDLEKHFYSLAPCSKLICFLYLPIFKVGPCESELSFIFHKKQYRSMPLRYLHGLAVLDTE